MQTDPILSSSSESYFMHKFVNVQALGLKYTTTRGSVGGRNRPDTELLTQILSAVHGKHLRTLILLVPLRSIQRRDLPVHLTLDDPQWKVLDELLCDVRRFHALDKVMLVVDYFDLDILLEMFTRGSDCDTLDMVKAAFKGVISTRRLQLVLRPRCVTIFIFNLGTDTSSS
jgi:hypothetical protein